MSDYPPSFFSDEIQLVRCITKEHRTDDYLISTAAYKLRSPEQMRDKKKEKTLSMRCLKILSMDEIEDIFWNTILIKEQEYGEICSSTHAVKKINFAGNKTKVRLLKRTKDGFVFEDNGQEHFAYTNEKKAHTSVHFLRALNELEENTFAAHMRNISPKAHVTKRKPKV